MKPFDYLIVGSGLFGATFAHQMRARGCRCLVIDKRPQRGGNVYCPDIEGIHVHRYGAHIFHTSDDEVWRYVTGLTPFNRYTNSPVADHRGRLYNLPFNMNTFYQMWGARTPEEARRQLEAQRAEARRQLEAEGRQEPANLEEQALLLVGRDLYERLIKGYTEKQWGRPCTSLPAFIIRRLPVRFVFDNNYFNDTHQGIPVGGYNRLVDALLEGVEVRCDTDFFSATLAGLHLGDGREHPGDGAEKLRDGWRRVARRLVYTGNIDEYFDYRFGPLAYRSVRFEEERLPVANYQGNAVVNYTDREVPFTRIIEHKHFERFGAEVEQLEHTIISREYSEEWHPGMEPYYPVNDERNSALYARYRALAEAESDVIFGGRLAEYKYYDMAPTIKSALRAAQQQESWKNC